MLSHCMKGIFVLFVFIRSPHHMQFFGQTLKVHLCDIPTVLSVCMKYHRCFSLQVIFLQFVTSNPLTCRDDWLSGCAMADIKSAPFLIPHAIHTESFPSCASPVPSAHRRPLLRNSLLRQNRFLWFFCPFPSKTAAASVVCMVNRDCTVKTGR